MDEAAALPNGALWVHKNMVPEQGIFIPALEP
jgi:hypothetical protein